VPLLGYGTSPLGKEKITRQHAVRCLNHAIDRGVTYLDTSPSYGSESHIGEVMAKRRDEVFLATKGDNRRKDSVLDEIKRSVEKLQTDHVDLIQIHAVNAWADMEQALAPDGAVAACEAARDQGLVRFIGITGHARPDILAQAIAQYRFDTVLCALGMADHLVSAADLVLLPRAVEREIGVIAMKTLGHGEFKSREVALRYSLGLPGVSLAIVGMTETEQIDENVEIAANFRPVTENDEQLLIDEVRPLLERDYKQSQEQGVSDLFWLHDTKVMGWQRDDEPQLVAY
jgi:aryl-alcohol dehydrogenase-like predicted oxidoreductase